MLQSLVNIFPIVKFGNVILAIHASPKYESCLKTCGSVHFFLGHKLFMAYLSGATTCLYGDTTNPISPSVKMVILSQFRLVPNLPDYETRVIGAYC